MEKSKKKYLGLKPIYIIVFLFAIGLMLGLFIPKVKTTNEKLTQTEEQQEIEKNSTIVPKVIGKTFEEAKKELEKVNLKLEKIEEKSKIIEKGYIMRQDPVYDTEIEEGETIKVYVSIGE